MSADKSLKDSGKNVLTLKVLNETWKSYDKRKSLNILTTNIRVMDVDKFQV